MKGKGGFTLIELLMVIIIIGILVGVGLPVYTSTVERARAKEAIDVISAIKEAQARYAQQNSIGNFLAITANNNYVAVPAGLDISWNTRYWNFRCAVPTVGRCNIIAGRIGRAADQNITFSFTNTNYQGTWTGDHPARPQNP